MTITLNGTSGITTPAITDVSTGNVTYTGTLTGGTGVVNLGSGQLVKDTSGNLGLGVAPSAWVAGFRALDIGTTSSVSSTSGGTYLNYNCYYPSAWTYKTSAASARYSVEGGTHAWYNAPSGTAGATIAFTQVMTLDASGNLLVGATSQISTERVSIVTNGTQALYTKNNAADFNFNCWNAATTGDNKFIQFITETSPAARGSITYNRAGGLVAYNVTSDYRAKDIYGPVVDSGALIDAVPVYIGKMKGATQERPMFIAHEVPAYAHTGVRDAVDADGNPIYQQMDASALVPVMWAEIQSLRKRLTALENK